MRGWKLFQSRHVQRRESDNPELMAAVDYGFHRIHFGGLLIGVSGSGRRVRFGRAAWSNSPAPHLATDPSTAVDRLQLVSNGPVIPCEMRVNPLIYCDLMARPMMHRLFVVGRVARR